MDLSAWTSKLWLCEPHALSRAVTRARTHGRCYTREEILAAHRESLEVAKSLAGEAVEGTGKDDPYEAEMATRPHHRIEANGDYVVDGFEIRAEAPRAIRSVKGKVGVIPIYGAIDQRMSSELMKAGGTSTEFINAALDNLLANPQVSAIVLRFDSPGGGVYSIQETADRIYNARADKPIYAHVDSMAASAGFWLASAASMIVATPGGDVGSVGVYRMHIDQSAALEKEGVKVSMVSAGKYKTEFAPFGPLGEEARAEMQMRVDETHVKFVNALSRNMDVPIDKVRKEFGEGRVVSAQDALKRNMIHRILPYGDFMKKLTGSETNSVQPMQNQVSAEVLLARHRLRLRKNLAKSS